MYVKIFLTFLTIQTIVFAGFQKVSIGNIDPFYDGKIDRQQLKSIIEEIEYTFENQLGFNVFDYAVDGKPIHLVYMPPSKLEKTIEYKVAKLSDIEKKIEDLNNQLTNDRTNVKKLKFQFNEKNSSYSKEVKKFNKYVKEVNRKKSYTQDEYKKIKEYVKNQKSKIYEDNKILKKQESKLKYLVKNFNNKARQYNNQIRKYNSLRHEIESMSRNIRKIKGRAFGKKEITFKHSYKNGKRFVEKSTKVSMDKIEVYGFEDFNQLKAILAHEIGHLVGLPHINSRNALMHPILQKNQERELRLTPKDVEKFYEHFEE